MTRCDRSNRDYEEHLEEWGVALNEEYQGLAFFDTRILGKAYVLLGLNDRLLNNGHLPYWIREAMPSHVGFGGIGRTFNSGGSYLGLQEQIDGSCNFSIGLVTTARGQSLSGRLYKIPLECVNEILNWQHQTACGTTKGSEYRKSAPEVDFCLRFLDASSQEIIGQAFPLRKLDLMNFSCMLLEDTEYQSGTYVGGKRLWLVTPLVGGVAKSYVKWVSVDIPKDDVAKIATVTISVEE